MSGQAAVNEQGEVVGVGDFGAQARQAVRNLDRVLNAAGSSLDQVIKVTIFVTDMSYFPEVVKLRKEVFSQPYPADTICEVQGLAYPELMFEIEAVALADGSTIDVAHSYSAKGVGRAKDRPEGAALGELLTEMIASWRTWLMRWR